MASIINLTTSFLRGRKDQRRYLWRASTHIYLALYRPQESTSWPLNLEARTFLLCYNSFPATKILVFGRFVNILASFMPMVLNGQVKCMGSNPAYDNSFYTRICCSLSLLIGQNMREDTRAFAMLPGMLAGLDKHSVGSLKRITKYCCWISSQPF